METTDNSFPVMSLNTFDNAKYQEDRKQARRMQMEQMEKAFAAATNHDEVVIEDEASVHSVPTSPVVTEKKSVPGSGSIRRARDLMNNLRSGLSTRSEGKNLAPRHMSDVESEEHLPNSDVGIHDVDTYGHAEPTKTKRFSGRMADCCAGCFYTCVGLSVLVSETLVAFWGARSRRQRLLLVALFVGLPLLIMTITLATKGGGGKGQVHDGGNAIVPPKGSKPIDIERYNTIRSTIVETALTSEGVVDAEGTAQNLALRWITDYDKAKLETDHDALLQRYALAVFFFSTFVTTNSTHTITTADTEYEWIQSDHWMSDKGICMWYGVECSVIRHEGVDESVYNDNSAVLRLNLTANNVQGTIPSEVVAFENLQLLELGENYLQGTIPASLGYLPDLVHLYAMDNQLTGTLPSDLGELRELENMHFGKNQLQGTVPNEFSGLRKLESLGLDQNFLSGTIPDLRKLQSLRILYLDKNEFTGSIPVHLGALASMEDLRIGSNHLTGTIPSEIFDLDRIELLYMDQNELTGTIPDLFSKTPRLEELQTYKNELSGPLPPSIGELNVLRLLYMDSNDLTGSIPTSYGQLDDLTTFYVYSNELTGSLPTEIGKMKDLRDLRIYQNKLTGFIPAEIGSAFNLEVLYIQDNELIGIIPDAVGDLDHLRSFRSYRNLITGTMPQSVCKLTTQYHLIFLAADCDEDAGTIECECCHECYP